MSAKWMKLTRLLKWPLSNCLVHWKTLGTLRSEDGDGSENVAEKVNSRSFNLFGDYSKTLTLSKVNPPKSWIPKKKERKREEISSLVYFRSKKWKQAFSRRSRAVTAKKCTKKRDARAKLFWLLNLLLFLTFSLSSPSSDLKSGCL